MLWALGGGWLASPARAAACAAAAGGGGVDGGSARPHAAPRSVAVIAHVDHGKTTLLDALLHAADALPSSVTSGGESRLMDGLALEKERGITISSKVTSLQWREAALSAVDTPGHADFGGEVERVLDMVDGAVLVVDALEGPMAQTKFVVQKAVAKGLPLLLCLNKVDREGATETQCATAESDVFDLLDAMGATEEQLDFRTVYASARDKWAAASYSEAMEVVSGERAPGAASEAMAPLLDAMMEAVPPPALDAEAPFSMLVSMVSRDPYLGRIATGRVISGRTKVGDRLRVLGADSAAKPASQAADGTARVLKVLKRRGTESLEIESAMAGDVVSLAGVSGATVTDTICAQEVTEALPATPIDAPTLAMTFSVNDSPLAGKAADGSKAPVMTGGKLGERLLAEAETNVSLRVRQGEGGAVAGEAYEVQGRGELHLGVLLETLTREGFELSVSPPAVLYRTSEGGDKLEPIEEVIADVDDENAGAVIEALTARLGELQDMVSGLPGGRTRLTFKAPTRGLVGFRAQFTNLTRGTGVATRRVLGYEGMRGKLGAQRSGVLVSMADGQATLHALGALEQRGTLFIAPGDQIYAGMIVGENARDGDMDVNPVRAKKLDNMRTQSKDEKVRLQPPRRMTLEDAMGYCMADELIECATGGTVRLRKRILDPSKRKATTRGGGK